MPADMQVPQLLKFWLSGGRGDLFFSCPLSITWRFNHYTRTGARLLVISRV